MACRISPFPGGPSRVSVIGREPRRHPSHNRHGRGPLWHATIPLAMIASAPHYSDTTPIYSRIYGPMLPCQPFVLLRYLFQLVPRGRSQQARLDSAGSPSPFIHSFRALSSGLPPLPARKVAQQRLFQEAHAEDRNERIRPMRKQEVFRKSRIDLDLRLDRLSSWQSQRLADLKLPLLVRKCGNSSSDRLTGIFWRF